MTRDPETIQREIEQTRAELASTFDQLAERTSPKRLAAVAGDKAKDAITSPPGLAVVGAVTLLIALGIARRARNRRRDRD